MIQATQYRVRNWESHFENSQSRKYTTVSWVPMPNKHDGKSLRRLMKMPDGLALYGAWVLIVQVASKCPKRGILADDDGPLTAEDIALKCNASEEQIQHALNVLSSQEIGWIECERWEHAGSTLPVHSQHAGSTLGARWEHATLNRIEQNRTEENKKEGAPDSAEPEPASVPEPVVRNDPPPKPPRFDPRKIDLPEPINTPEVLAAWVEWCDYRSKKRKPVTQDSIDRLMPDLIRYGPEGTVETIRHSIKQDYQGIFEPPSKKGQTHGRGSHAPAGAGQTFREGDQRFGGRINL